jgi:nucleolar protein 53
MIEVKRIQAEKKLSDFVEKMERAKLKADEDLDGVPPGMKLDLDEEVEEVVDQDDAGNLLSRPLPERKTKQQRRKAAKLRAEVIFIYFHFITAVLDTVSFQKRALVIRAARKRTLASVSTIKSERRRAEQALLLREEISARRRSARLQRLKHGLGGTKIGKNRVPESDVTVQLDEDLSESLRELKVCYSLPFTFQSRHWFSPKATSFVKGFRAYNVAR